MGDEGEGSGSRGEQKKVDPEEEEEEGEEGEEEEGRVGKCCVCMGRGFCSFSCPSMGNAKAKESLC